MRERGFLRETAWGLAIVLLCAGRTLRGRPRQAVAEPSLTQINLQKFGWQQPPRVAVGEADWTSQRVAIDHKGRVLVCFPVRKPVSGLPHHSGAELALRILRFTADGKTDLSLTVPTNNWYGYGVYLDGRDDIIARADRKLQILIPKGEARSKQNEWKTLAPCGPTCEIIQSPSRRTLYLDDTKHYKRNVTIITGNQLRDVRNCAAPGLPALHITDTFAYYFNSRPVIGSVPLRYRDYTDRWPLCDYSQRTELPMADAVMPLSDDALLAATKEQYVIYRADGKVKSSFQRRLSKHEGAWMGWVPEQVEGVSENGKRIAPMAMTQRGGISWLDISPHLTAQRVIVIDVATGQQLASIPVSHPTYFLDRAISPDGRRVAFLLNSTLTIADVP